MTSNKPKQENPERTAVERPVLNHMDATKLLAPLLGLAGTFSIHAAASADWLIDPSSFKAQIHHNAERHEVILDNGLVRRVIRLAPNAATVSFENVMTGESIIRGVRPEARVMLDGVRYDIGGLDGQPVQNFLTVAELHGEYRIGHPRTRWLIPRRHLRRDESPVSSGF